MWTDLNVCHASQPPQAAESYIDGTDIAKAVKFGPKHHKRLAGKDAQYVISLVVRKAAQNWSKVMLMETSVFSTILVNSSKLILPSRSKSASIMVLSTICAGVSRVCLHCTLFPYEAYLLQLLVLQVASNHHLEHDKELAVADVTVTVDVVDAEGKAQLLFLVAFAAKGREARDKLLEIDITTTILVEDGNHSCS